MNEQTLRDFLKARFPAYRDELGLQDDLTRVVDSLGLFDLVAFVEAEIKASIPTAMFSPDRFSTIQHTLDFVDEVRAFSSRVVRSR